MTVKLTASRLAKVAEFVLLLAILGLLIWSQPWSGSSSGESRKISVVGEATVEAVPDEYILSPYFQLSGTDEEQVKAQLTQQANEAVERLKELGISEDDIELDASSYDYWYFDDNQTGNLSISLTITIRDKDLAQEAQDYLLNLENIEGQLTPRAIFSKEKTKELEKQAIEKAIEDAREKANSQAVLFGAEVGEVIEVGDSGSEQSFPLISRGAELQVAEDSVASSLPVLPGTDEYSKTVNVTFELK